MSTALYKWLVAAIPNNVVTVQVDSEDACDLLLEINSSGEKGQVVFSRDSSDPQKFIYTLFAVMNGRNLILNQ